MTAVVTGGAGFLGGKLIDALLGHAANAPATVVSVDRTPSPSTDPRVRSVVGDISDAAVARAALADDDVTTVWHLAAVLSGQSEVEPELAWAVNVGGTEALLDAARALRQPPRFVLASTVAVFGGPLPAVVPEDFACRPQSTYGTTKAIAELLVLEATRRGVVDGVACRVPTVSVRPGVPNSAMSSFVSGVVREPLAGVEAVCPVPLDTALWVASPDVTVHNLVRAGTVPPSGLGSVRTLNLPGITVTPADLLVSLERAAGATVRQLVRVEPDPVVSGVVGSWPAAFDVTRALSLGFVVDRDADAIVTQFIAARASG